MAETRIGNIIIPDVWHDYMLEESTRNNTLINSGIVVPDDELDDLALKGGKLIDMPYFKDLTGDDEVLQDDTALTINNIETGQDRARLHARGKAFGSNDLAKALSGADPMAAIAFYIGGWWAGKEQDLLISSLKGVFANNAVESGSGGNDSDLIHTVAAEATADIVPWNGNASGDAQTVMNPIAILDGAQKLGDAKGKFTALMMHSKCLTDLIKQDLIEFRPASEGKDEIPYYLNKRVIENDSCPTRAGTGTGTPTVYRSFLFAEGAIGRGEGAAPVPVETGRQELGGVDFLITRRHFILHPRGFYWNDSNIALTAGPSNAECEEAAQWTRVYQKKNTRIVMIETN